ncbi:TetR/AcrR family transcriptional regulator [Blastococcus sp. TML/M2B]|uniref:TetR family transcriptional regulator n=1 Tax=unclassified Blastococcus TaxID=2619396 RepID=UPI00190ADF4A|nr:MULTISPECIES: TetR family transcriptional regulator [unclassified Blastococcus]MBN1092603.1 TetR/AcrR family transcriptional regulator [Blastococcus sp. TML/M2B]MBN1097304.1 TetR/AcrR family transcriptional regulator [Blastococcus sp. TML/C7B]
MQPPALDVASGAASEAPTDGRRARWTEHRRARREDLVTAAVEAVRLAGPEFAVEDVARSAGVSKTVIYRYFSDKDELVDAVLNRISEAILLPRLMGELAAERADDRAQLHAVIAAFVALIEDEPALYRFAYAHAGRSGRADLVAATEREIAESLGVLMGERLSVAGRSPDAALTWAYGVVGMVQLAAHWWSAARTVPAAQLVDQLTDLAHGGLGTLLPPTR